VATTTFTHTGAEQNWAAPNGATADAEIAVGASASSRIEEAGMTVSDLTYAFVNAEPMQRQRLRMLEA
jgi:hypothetical protein